MSNCTSDITIIGYLTRDPEVFNSPKSGKNFAKVTIAVNKTYPKDLTNYYSCYFDEAQLERMQKASVKKGSLIKVVGEFNHLTYEKTDPQTKQPNGDHGFDLRVVGWTWDFIPSSAKKNDTAAAPAADATGAAPVQTATPGSDFESLPVDSLADDLPF